MELDQRTQSFVEHVGMVMERWGMTRTFGQLLGLLLVADEPISLDELSQKLQVSKAAVSNNVRMYREIGFLKRVTRPGDRRDYYEVPPNSLENSTEKRLAAIDEMIRLAEAGMAAVGDPERPAHNRLVEMRAFYEYVGASLADALAEWRRRKPELLEKQG